MRSVHWAWISAYRQRDLERLVNAELRIAEAPPGEHDMRVARREARYKREYQRKRASHVRGSHEQT